MKKLAALVSVPLLALSLAACSSGSDGASKEDVKKGLVKTFDSMGYPKDDLEEFAGCVADKAYDSLSAKERNALAEGLTVDDPDAQKKLDFDEKGDKAMDKAMEDCYKK